LISKNTVQYSVVQTSKTLFCTVLSGGGFMGTWGAGNFEDDTALDHLSALRNTYKLEGMCAELLRAVRDAMANTASLEPDEYEGVIVPCNLKIIAQMMDTFGPDVCKLPKPNVLGKWKTTYLNVWDGYIDELEPDPDWKQSRREVLGQTFDRVLEHSKAQHET
jgi:hypothetical protein